MRHTNGHPHFTAEMQKAQRQGGKRNSFNCTSTDLGVFHLGVFQLSWRPSRRLNSKPIYARICFQKPSILVSKMATCGRVAHFPTEMKRTRFISVENTSLARSEDQPERSFLPAEAGLPTATNSFETHPTDFSQPNLTITHSGVIILLKSFFNKDCESPLWSNGQQPIGNGIGNNIFPRLDAASQRRGGQ